MNKCIGRGPLGLEYAEFGYTAIDLGRGPGGGCGGNGSKAGQNEVRLEFMLEEPSRRAGLKLKWKRNETKRTRDDREKFERFSNNRESYGYMQTVSGVE